MLSQGFSDGDSRMNMKRKDFDLEELSDFPLTSPARKIRRLDAELVPIIEEPGPDIPVDFQNSQQEFDLGCSTQRGGVVIEELPSTLEENEERAIVLFNPANASITRAPANYAFSVSPQFISSFKNDVPWSRHSSGRGMLDGEEPEREENQCLAVVPWVPSHQPSSSEAGNTKVEVSDMMDAEDMEVETMEVEESPAGYNPATGMNMNTNMNMNDGLHQWQMQQQHCLIPQPPQNTSTPIVWYR